MKIKKVLALLFFLGCACAASVALPACSGTQQAEQANATASKAGRSSRTGGTVTVGKVQSVVGNQVVLAVGTLGGQSGRSGGSQSAPPSGNASVSASSGSGGITLTGETKTVLIPVGLSLSSGSTGRASGAPGGSAASASGGRGFGAQRGGSGGSGSRAGGTEGGGPAAGASRGGAGSAGASVSAASGSARRAEDFSSIKAGMVLQIVEETLSDGTTGITEVRVLSR